MRCTLPYPMPLSELAAMIGARSEADSGIMITGIATDSREIKKGDLFLALSGQRSNGADYLSEAFANGASLALSESLHSDSRILTVPDVPLALGRLASGHASRIPHITVAVTGSVGKTTVRTYLNAVLKKAYTVTAAQENHNTDIGMPLTVLTMPRDSDCLLLEMGMRARGEIAYLSSIAHPDIAIITCIGTSHLETLGTKEEILQAKLEITAGMPQNGILLYSADDPMLGVCRTLGMRTYGISKHTDGGDYTLEDIRETAGETVCTLHCPEQRIRDIRLQGNGDAALYAAAFSGAACDLLGLSANDIRSALSLAGMPRLRQTVIRKGGIVFIADCYNASPESMLCAFSLLKSYRTERRRRFALLGDMRELGSEAPALHRYVGQKLASFCPDGLITYGELAREIAVGARLAGMRSDQTVGFAEGEEKELVRHLLSILEPGDLLLVKASRAMHAELILNDLLSAIH